MCRKRVKYKNKAETNYHFQIRLTFQSTNKKQNRNSKLNKSILTTKQMHGT